MPPGSRRTPRGPAEDSVRRSTASCCLAERRIPLDRRRNLVGENPPPVRHGAELLDVGLETDQRPYQEQPMPGRSIESVLDRDGRDLDRLFERPVASEVVCAIFEERLEQGSEDLDHRLV